MRILSLLLLALVLNPAYGQFAPKKQQTPAVESSQLKPAECKSVEEFYEFFQKNHIASRDQALAPKVTSKEAFFNGMTHEFAKQVDPLHLTLIEDDVKALVDANPEELSTVIIKNKDCSSFEKITAQYEKAKLETQKAITALLAKPDLKAEVLEAAKKFDGMSKEDLRALRKKNDKMPKTAVELEERRMTMLVQFYMTGKIVLSDLSSNLEDDAFIFAKKTLRRSVFKEEKATVAEKMLKAALAGADAHSVYMTAPELVVLKDMMTSQFIGAGLSIIDGGRGIFIAKVIEGGAAELSGKFKKGDLVLKVNGLSTEDMDAKDFRDQSVGEKGTPLTLVYERDGKILEETIIRQKVDIQTTNITTKRLKQGDKTLGYIKLVSFTLDDSATEMEKRMNEMVKEGPIDGWILDLRGNGGGLLNMATDISGLFLGSRRLVTVASHTKMGVRPLTTPNVRQFFKEPMVVLISKTSASASEIVAGALQLQGRALVVGDSETSFRKGTIQGVFPMEKEGLAIDGGLRLTMGFFYNINGEPFQNRGVKTDIQVPVKEDVKPEDDINESTLEHALPTPSNLTGDPRLIDIHSRQRAPMLEVVKRIGTKYGADFVKAQEGKEDIVLEAGQGVLADLIDEVNSAKKLNGLDLRKAN